DRPPVRFRLVLRELEQVERSLDVDFVRRHRRELGAGREQRREVKDPVDLEFRHHALEQRLVDDRAGDLAIDLPGDRVLEPRDVDRDDATVPLLGEAIDEAVADLSTGPGNDDDGFAHQRNALTIDQTMAMKVTPRQTAAPTK